MHHIILMLSLMNLFLSKEMYLCRKLLIFIIEHLGCGWCEPALISLEACCYAGYYEYELSASFNAARVY